MIKQVGFLFCLSMVPVIELRGAIPLGMSWGLPFWQVFAVCVLGNLLPVPFLVTFAERVLRWGVRLPKVGSLCAAIIRRGEQKANSIAGAEMLGLFLFVAIPLPGTGAWTGSLAAALLGLPVKKAVLPIAAGVVTAGIIMGIGTYGVLSFI
jgi:uncharacterized membrane protein